jgi:hypothetical protein
MMTSFSSPYALNANGIFGAIIGMTPCESRAFYSFFSARLKAQDDVAY